MHDIGVFFLCLLFALVVCLLECTEIVTESDLPFFSFPTVSPICHSRTLREGESQRHTEAYSHMSTHTHTQALFSFLSACCRRSFFSSPFFIAYSGQALITRAKQRGGQMLGDWRECRQHNHLPPPSLPPAFCSSQYERGQRVDSSDETTGICAPYLICVSFLLCVRVPLRVSSLFKGDRGRIAEAWR